MRQDEELIYPRMEGTARKIICRYSIGTGERTLELTDICAGVYINEVKSRTQIVYSALVRARTSQCSTNEAILRYLHMKQSGGTQHFKAGNGLVNSCHSYHRHGEKRIFSIRPLKALSLTATGGYLSLNFDKPP